MTPEIRRLTLSELQQIHQRAKNAALDWALQSDEPCDLIDDLLRVCAALLAASPVLTEERLKAIDYIQTCVSQHPLPRDLAVQTALSDIYQELASPVLQGEEDQEDTRVAPSVVAQEHGDLPRKPQPDGSLR